MSLGAVVISGAGSGIGRAMALELAKEGWQCLLLGRREEALKETLAALPGNGHDIACGDVRDRIVMQQIAAGWSGMPIRALVANAGLGGENHYGENDRWDEIISTNLSGTYEFVQAFLPGLKPAPEKPAYILMTSSVLARLGVAGYTAYCASKAGLLGLMRSWAVELAPRNILVNAICPGWVETDMSREGMEGLAEHLGISVEAFHDLAMKSVPLGRMSQPQEIAQLTAYLLKQRSITGQALDINGGSVMNS
ncbi:MAG: SDR family oxidoreductase [Bacteroidetes bacterium]|nr:SDR family oxidoreductase [Bacteroidota bacterium]